MRKIGERRIKSSRGMIAVTTKKKKHSAIEQNYEKYCHATVQCSDKLLVKKHDRAMHRAELRNTSSYMYFSGL